MHAHLSLLVAVGFSLAALSPSTASADTPPLRWSRPVRAGQEGQAGQADQGWVRVDLPADVLAACRPGIPDLRVRSASGGEVPYVVEQSLGGGAPEEWVARNVESVAGRETTAIVDRGAHPPLADQATIEVDATEFLKPIVLEASDDAREWKQMAKSSIFAAGAGRAEGRMTTVRFAPNDRRYWRLRLDDRNGAPVTPRAVLSGAIVKTASAPRELPLDVKRAPADAGGDSGASTYEVTLPSANLTVTSLALEPTDVAFVRPVSVAERVLFRDEVTRRVVGASTVRRGPGGELLTIPVGELRGPSLEIAIEDGASPPLTLPRITATVASRSILFFVPPALRPVALEYGSSVLPAVHYDLGPALAGGLPPAIALGSLGAPVDRGAASPIGVPPHGALVDESGWRTKATIDLPSGGGVAYLPLEGIDAWAGLRVVDATSHEVPYVFEQTVHRARETVQPTLAESPGRTTATLANLAGLHELGAIELTATAPDYFVRSVTVVELARDARGPTGERVLGSGTWERRPGEAAPPMTVTIASPSQPTIEVRIDNASNSPLVLGPMTLARSVRRIDFVTAPGESLSLLSGSSSAGTPNYDLALLAGALFSLPAHAARLEPARDIAPAHAPPAKWFWVAVIVAGLAVAGVLARALSAPKPPSPAA